MVLTRGAPGGNDTKEEGPRRRAGMAERVYRGQVGIHSGEKGGGGVYRSLGGGETTLRMNGH